MRTGIRLGYAGGIAEADDHVADLENAGVLDLVLVPEAYSYHAVSQLGYLAAKTSTIELGSGVIKALHIINHLVRERIPISIAALGPKNVELSAEIAEGWQPIFVYPRSLESVWGESIRAGLARRDPAVGPLDIMASPSLAIGEDVDQRLVWAKPQLALYLRGMGAKGNNFYNNRATRYGFGAEANRIQELYLAGRKDDAISAVPDELVRNVSLIGPQGFVKERVAAFAEAGVTTLVVSPLSTDPGEYLR
jgi:F420-dependent oxidoreductase-like protein